MNQSCFCLLSLVSLFLLITKMNGQNIPLPEHPRPDFERPAWKNLNGQWAFAFDADNSGIDQGWQEGKTDFPLEITVPFPWGSKLSGQEDKADIAWYQKSISVPSKWKDERTFLTIGASDWETSVWLDGQLIGIHQGGYVPFSFELTKHVRYDEIQQLVIKVDDARRTFTLYGKQGYGNARGIWQTIYLEARGKQYLEALHFTPDIDHNKVTVTAYLPEKTQSDLTLQLDISTNANPIKHQAMIQKGKQKAKFQIDIPNPRLWNLEDPFLYEVKATLDGKDEVKSYFGMRKISVTPLPGTDFPYIALNGQPIYLQMALDQSYHPEGFYTFPSDQFLQEEIMRSKSIGLNGIRTHIKVEVPRKLYWADKLGLLVMEDLPNSWGEPDEDMQAESEYTLRQMIKRDYNHPSIFSWVVFNETWGLRTNVVVDGKEERQYLPETQDWVASMYYLAKSLDQTRLVEDNSICCGAGHTETDINSWHVYLPGWEWESYLQNLTENTYEGSEFNYEDGFRQGPEPNFNSECGNVWGYEGSTGDVDWSYDYHRMINTFRKYPKVGGWLYTEHHDVINEWNGYWRFDRTEKQTGLGEIVRGMSLKDLHAPVFVSTGNEICKTVRGGPTVSVPLYLSVMTEQDYGPELTLSYELTSMNYVGETEKSNRGSIIIPYRAWMQKTLDPLSIRIPEFSGLATLQLRVLDAGDKVLSRNFMHFEITSDTPLPNVRVLSVPAKDFTDASWSQKQWNVREGRKINGAGKGFFEYTIKIPKKVKANKAKFAFFQVEVSAKELFVKDQQTFDKDQDYMKGSKVAPSSNPNSYPMTDATFFPSEIEVSVNGVRTKTTVLSDDPADHRGVLSWHHQLKNRKLEEAGSYGYLLNVPIDKRTLKAAIKAGQLKVNIRTIGEGGIAVYGKEFGRYPLDPSLVLKF